MVFGRPAGARVKGWGWRPLPDSKTSPAVDQTHCNNNILHRCPRSARRSPRAEVYRKKMIIIIDADHLLKCRNTCGEETSPFIVYVSFRVYRCSVRVVEAVEVRGILWPWW